MTYTHDLTVDNSLLANWQVDPYDPGAKDRRALVRALYGDWFETNKLKLTRDYMVEFMGNDYYGSGAKGYTPAGYQRKQKIRITIHDSTKAMLFKLTHGGVL